MQTMHSQAGSSLYDPKPECVEIILIAKSGIIAGPWINNCVGERNQKYFLQFLVYVGILAIYSVVLVLGSWIYPCETCAPDLPESQTRMYVLYTYLPRKSLKLNFLLELIGFTVYCSCLSQLYSDYLSLQLWWIKCTLYSMTKPPSKRYN